MKSNPEAVSQGGGYSYMVNSALLRMFPSDRHVNMASWASTARSVEGHMAREEGELLLMLASVGT